MTNILYALIMYMYMYGFLNAFKIKLLEILLIKWIEIIFTLSKKILLYKFIGQIKTCNMKKHNT